MVAVPARLAAGFAVLGNRTLGWKALSSLAQGS